jgi:cysteinyl-tRNA synthetase
LGNTIDIHGGGQDLIFPHHENEIAQAEALTGEKFVKYWLHNGFITVSNEKMSKSLDNFFILRDILKKYSPEVVRFYLISTHYRSPLDFDDGKLEEAKKALRRIKTTCLLAEEFVENADVYLSLPVNGSHCLSERLASWRELLLKDGQICEKILSGRYPAEFPCLRRELSFEEYGLFVKKIDDLRGKFIEAMDDDFNTAKAIGFLFEIIRELNVFVAGGDRLGIASRLTAAAVLSLLRDLLGNILGLLENTSPATTDDKPEKLLNALSELGKRACGEKFFQISDAIRDLLRKNGVIGVIIEDTSDGSRLKYENPPDLDLLITEILKLRDNMKQNKNYQWADAVRQELLTNGIIIEDTKQGSRWKMID